MITILQNGLKLFDKAKVLYHLNVVVPKKAITKKAIVVKGDCSQRIQGWKVVTNRAFILAYTRLGTIYGKKMF